MFALGLSKFAVKPSVFSATGLCIRSFSTSHITFAEPKKPKKKQGDISQIPIKHLGVLAPYYIPPPIFSSPITLWHKLVLRRMGQFVFNTYSVYKFKTETGRQVAFNHWKDNAIDLFVRVNKAFANKNLNSVKNSVGVHTLNVLQERIESLPKKSKIAWELVKIEQNPKIVSFNALPDNNGITAIIQFVMKLQTRQKVTISNKQESNNEPVVQERSNTDYLVYTLDPISDEMCLVGTLFESDHLRQIQPDMDVANFKQMMDFQKEAADIFRQKNN